MFSTIFKYELKYWFKKPTFYIYAIIFLIISILMAGMKAGVFDNITTAKGASIIVNSPMKIVNMFSTLTGLIFFLFPSIIGFSVFRDYKSNMHTILYSYPFTKSDYLLAKFFSSITIVVIITLTVGIGMYIGFSLPGVNPKLLGEFKIRSYLHAYLVYILPNILLYGAIIFAVVVFTRKIVAGFAIFIILLLFQVILVNLFSNSDYAYIAALLDPTGTTATLYFIKYWTVVEQNTLNLPIEELIIYNRLLWFGIALAVFGVVFKFFKFSLNTVPFSFRKPKGKRSTKTNFGSIIHVNLPQVNYDFSFKQHLKITWKQSHLDFKYILKSIPFIIILLAITLGLIIDYYEGSRFRGTSRFPLTWRMLDYGEMFQLAIIICTFLYAGMLSQRSRNSNINILVDSTPIPNWTLLLSRLIALFKMQWVMLLIVMISGISFQIYKGYYQFEIGQYLFELFILNFMHYALWAIMALWIQSLIKNPFLGLFLLFIIFIIVSTSIPNAIGIEQDIFIFNYGTSGFSYSDMNGYGASLSSIFIYSLYWFLFGILLIILANLFFIRGLSNSFTERLFIAKLRLTRKLTIYFGVILITFLSFGFKIYYENNIENTYLSAKEREQIIVDIEKKYNKYKDNAQPKITSVKINLDIFPKTLDFNLKGNYQLVNKTEVVIDTIFLKHNHYPSTFLFDRETTLISEDSLYRFNIYHLKKPLLPGDSIKLDFTIKNKPNTLFSTHSPILENGTFLNNFKLMPTIGYKERGLTNNDIRKQYGLPNAIGTAHPSDLTSLGRNELTRDADWVEFEATVSTSKDQIAIAPGYLQKEWFENDRRYFHYKMDQKMLNIYSFNSARYEVKKDVWNDVKLEIYYHKGHDYNLDRMIAGMKASLAYNSKHFSPYQHKQLRIIEFPKTFGGYAQSYPNTIPFSENHGFIADVDDDDVGGIDYAFGVTSHEVAHQWWAHQVIGADVLGATMLTESVSEYVRLKTLEQQYGKEHIHTFLKYALDHYLKGRKNDISGESPLMYVDGQSYIRYSKGALIFYALSDYVGEENLNIALRKFVQKNRFKEPPYPTSIELVNNIREVTPDSLQYIIKDMFETITFYDNKTIDFKTTQLNNGTYKVEVEFLISKYRSDKKGIKIFCDKKTIEPLTYKDKEGVEIKSLPLADYIEVGIFITQEVEGKNKEVELYLQKHKVSGIYNTISIIVDKKPTRVSIDPYSKLIDINSKDN